MVPARPAKDRLGTFVNAQKRRALLSESCSTHHDRRGTTSITWIISPAILRMSLLYSSESAFYDAILNWEHHFYNSFSRGASLVDEIDPKASKLSHRRISFPMQYSFCMTMTSVRMIVLNSSSSHNMIDTAQHYKTNQKRMNMYKIRCMLISHTLTIAKVRFIYSHKIRWTGTASNRCIKPLRLPMELKHAHIQKKGV